MTTSKGLLTFKSFSDTPFARSNSVIISQLIDEIDELIHKGCSRELIYKSLTSEPYNLVVTYQSFVTLLSRARAKKRKNPLSSDGGEYQNPRPVVTTPQNSGGAELPKGVKLFKKMNSDAPKFEQNPNPSLDELLKGNNNG
ncbi:TPA: hypothetical protein ACISYD_004172 [Salmonella enterica subsp. enterica serovar Saintpaul]|nr:hypothetical protein [Salmonella enterica]ECO9785257.1 hypothetical protein [Salmonella enterica]EGN8179516.1 hypothetical protein [Salmonella enterica]HCM9439158.1 hypothetical protein [Enterobacter hormaechei subsp. xiangfangensis]